MDLVIENVTHAMDHLRLHLSVSSFPSELDQEVALLLYSTFPHLLLSHVLPYPLFLSDLLFRLLLEF
eukprot:UN10401